MSVLAIDPGPTQSAFVHWDGVKIYDAEIVPNEKLLSIARTWLSVKDIVAIEMIACYGMAVGKEVFETCLFIGKLQEALAQRFVPTRLVFRRDVKLHHCNSARAKDANVRQALIDKYGAPGTKKAPGVTYGIKSHLWAALAIATYVTETQQKAPLVKRKD